MRQKKQTKMYSLVQEWQTGEQTKKAFCKAHQLNPTTFHYWIQKYKLSVEPDSTKEQSSPFVALSVSSPSVITNQVVGSGHTCIELNYPNGVHLRLNGLVNINYLSSLIKLAI